MSTFVERMLLEFIEICVVKGATLSPRMVLLFRHAIALPLMPAAWSHELSSRPAFLNLERCTMWHQLTSRSTVVVDCTVLDYCVKKIYLERQHSIPPFHTYLLHHLSQNKSLQVAVAIT